MNYNDNVFYLPKVVYNMSANYSGDIVELLSPVIKNKYGDIFEKPPNDYLGDNTDIVCKLISMGVYADNVENDKLYVSKDGVNIEIELIAGNTRVISVYNQIMFLLREIRKEQQVIFDKTMRDNVERLQQWRDKNEK